MQPLKLVIAIICISLAIACGKSSSEPPAAAAPPQEDPAVVRMRALQEGQARIKAEREKKREELRAAGEATLKKKAISGPKGKEKLELEFELTNKSTKDLMMAEGTMIMRDAQGNPLRKLKIPFTEKIAAGKSTTKKGKFPLDAANDSDHALVKIPLAEMKNEWIISKYRYADGSELIGE